MNFRYRILVKVILAVMKQLKQLQRKTRENPLQRLQRAMFYQLSYEALLVVGQGFIGELVEHHTGIGGLESH